MNDKFFSLPEEKQQAIINAGYRVFAQNSYKKSPMSEIASAAGISKSLLFHYFLNKKELYLFLLENCAGVTLEYLKKNDCYNQADLFETMFRGLSIKIHIMRKYPDFSTFLIKAYYERDPEVRSEVQAFIEKYAAYKVNRTLLKLEPEQFIPGLDLKMMYQEMYWASEGYLWEKLQQGNIDVDQMEKEFMELIHYWRTLYQRKSEEQ